MEKKRVYTIAEELGISSKELIAKLEELDIKVSSHMSTLTIEEAEIIVEMLREEKEAKIIKQKEPKSKKIDIDTIKEDDEEEQSRRDLDKKNKNKTWYKVISWIITMHLVMFGFLIFSGKMSEWARKLI